MKMSVGISWEDVERMLASGSPQDTLSHLQALDKILNAAPKAPTAPVTVPGIDDYVFTFEYTRELPVDDYYIGNQPNLEQADSKKEVGDFARILTMRSENYADVMDCFSPIFADPACLDDTATIPLSTLQPSSNLSSSSSSDLSATPSDLLTSLRGRAKEEVVPLLLSSNLPTATKVDVALQYFSTCK